MRNLILLLSIVFFISCSSVPKKYLTDDDICHYNDPFFKITEDEMTFDVEKYKDSLKKEILNLVLIDNKKYKEEIHGIENYIYTLIKTDKEKQIEKYIEYYPNGSIMQSEFYYINGEKPLGQEIDYDQNKKITNIVNYEKNYTICGAEAIEIVKKIAEREIKEYEIKKFELRRIKDINIWKVTLIDGNEKYKKFTHKKNGDLYYHIDGKTGKNIVKYKIKKKRKKIQNNLKYALINIFNSVSKEYLTTNDICHYNDPIFKITKDEMTFDVEKYEKELEKGDLVLVDNKKFKNRYYKYPDGEIVNKQTNKQTNIAKWIRYNKNGRIIQSEFMYIDSDIDGDYIGKKTEYDQQGNITKVIDHEKGYQICWAEAIEIVKKIAKKDIKKYNITGFNLSHTNLNEYPKEKPVWRISLDGNEEYEIKDTKVYWIDGVTGKYIKTTKIITVCGNYVE